MIRSFSPRAGEPHGAAPRRSGRLWRILDAMSRSRERAADRDIARLLTAAGGGLTDDIERRMMSRVTTPDWSLRR